MLVGGDDQVAEHLHGTPLVVVEDLALILDGRGACGGRRMSVLRLLRGGGGRRDAQDLDEIAAGDIHGSIRFLFFIWSAM